MQSRAAITPVMPLIADRFLVDQDDVVDLATGETVQLSIEAGTRTKARARLCDRLFAVRHPLLLPLLDYGTCARGWFEAHASRPVHRTSGVDARTSALHLVRFLRDCGIDLDAAAAARNVRPAVDMPALAPHRPIAVRLQARPPLEAVRTVLESTGPPGVTSMAICGAIGAGLRTARLHVARAARLAGYLVIDSRFGALEEVLKPARHYCVIDWLSRETTLPPLLTLAACAGARRHAWIRFCRHPVDDAGSIGLEPLMTRELTKAIYLDAECGPTAMEVQRAVSAAGGLPGPAINVLTAFGGQPGISWVHETAPEYVVRDRVSPEVARVASGGIARLERAVEAAHALARRGRHARAARVLRRCSRALAARGANRAAAEAACSLGDLHLDRGRLDAALEAFQRAQTWCQEEPSVAARALIGSGRAMLEQGRIADAEGVFRTACLAGTSSASGAKRWLAETLILRGRVEAAEEALDGSDPALSSTIARLQGDIAAASRAAARALEATGRDPAGECAAHLAMAHVQAALGSLDGVRRHGAAAEALSRRLRSPAQRLRVAAEVLACLDQCGVRNQSARGRLLRATRRMPPLAAARTRTVLGAATPADATLIAVRPGTSDLIHRFRSLITAIHDAPDESAALQAIVTDLHASLDACSVIIRSAILGRVVAGTGRSWAGEEAFTKAALDGGGSILQAGVTPEAAEPVVAGGTILGVIGIRWVTGARPPAARVRDVLRTAAVATAPMLRGLHLPARAPAAAEATYPDALLGPGPSAERVREAIRRAALAPYPVLIEGESGSGKELVARSIHARSARRGRRFCAVNCAALTDDLLEAELFGHARGAFTGAVTDRPGLFEEADQGTLLLDEAAELTARAQAKLLRVLQEGEIRRIGENLPRRIDTRVVAATNRPLDAEVRNGRFRPDLRFRLDVIRIVIPPLRERPDDVPWLVERIWADAATRVGTRATLGPDVIGALARYEWPGNVRELQNVIAALAVHGPRRGRMPASLLPVHIAGARVAATGIGEARHEFERRFVRAALARAGGRRSRAAAQLGVSRQGLAKIIKRLGL